MSARMRWNQIEAVLNQGRRNSMAKIVDRVRSGSLPSWAGGGPLFPGYVGHSASDRNDEGNPDLWRQHGNANLGFTLSAMYAKLLIILGIAFPLTEVISSYIPSSYYDGFYLYLYFVSILFMGCIFSKVVKDKATVEIAKGINTVRSRLHSGSSSPSIVRKDSAGEPDCTDEDGNTELMSLHPTPVSVLKKDNNRNDNCVGEDERKTKHCSFSISNIHDDDEEEEDDEERQTREAEEGAQRSHFGSFYLRIGAVAFGIGSLIYSGLEFGEFFELENDTSCNSYMKAVTPIAQMIFTFMQMYFVFLNSNMAVSKVSWLKQFGLMHMIGTNLCIWLHVLVQETKHEILHFYDPIHGTVAVHDHGDHSSHSESSESQESQESSEILNNNETDPEGHYSMYDCRRLNIMGSVVNDASPFLFPCTIEFSLICAAVCYVMWKSMAKRKVAAIIATTDPAHGRPDFLPSTSTEVKSPHQYTVDCAGSNKGLFIGILFLVTTIMSLILNFVLIKHPEYKDLAAFEVNVIEVILYSLTTLAILLAILQVRSLRYDSRKNLELDNILLIVAQTGSFVFNVFCIIGGHLSPLANNNLQLVTPLLCLIQLLLQTLFILDASKRCVATSEQAKKKPGREIVTFLLITNLAMWLVNVLIKSRGDTYPHLRQLYGVWGWTIITRIFMPLAIFYRFHSTVCLCEVWKKAYKIK